MEYEVYPEKAESGTGYNTSRVRHKIARSIYKFYSWMHSKFNYFLPVWGKLKIFTISIVSTHWAINSSINVVSKYLSVYMLKYSRYVDS